MATVTKLCASVKTAIRPKIKGLVELYRTPEGDSWGILNVAICGEATLYWVRRIGSDFGDGFELQKFSTFGNDIYHVHLSNEGHSCDCPGGTYHGRCKHMAALAKLRDHGRI
jgi:SWIM zinc finger